MRTDAAIFTRRKARLTHSQTLVLVHLLATRVLCVDDGGLAVHGWHCDARYDELLCSC